MSSTSPEGTSVGPSLGVYIVVSVLKFNFFNT